MPFLLGTFKALSNFYIALVTVGHMYVGPKRCETKFRQTQFWWTSGFWSRSTTVLLTYRWGWPIRELSSGTPWLKKNPQTVFHANQQHCCQGSYSYSNLLLYMCSRPVTRGASATKCQEGTSTCANCQDHYHSCGNHKRISLTAGNLNHLQKTQKEFFALKITPACCSTTKPQANICQLEKLITPMEYYQTSNTLRSMAWWPTDMAHIWNPTTQKELQTEAFIVWFSS